MAPLLGTFRKINSPFIKGVGFQVCSLWVVLNTVVFFRKLPYIYKLINFWFISNIWCHCVVAHILCIINQIRACIDSATFNYANDLDCCCYKLNTAQRILLLANEMSLVSNECINIIGTLKDEIKILERRHVKTYFQAELQDGQNRGRPK